MSYDTQPQEMEFFEGNKEAVVDAWQACNAMLTTEGMGGGLRSDQALLIRSALLTLETAGQTMGVNCHEVSEQRTCDTLYELHAQGEF